MGNKTPSAIVLNGPSSSGKSTFASLLQEKSDDPFLTLGIDQIIQMMPKKLNDYHADMAKRDGYYWIKSQDQTKNTIMQLTLGDYAKQIHSLYQCFALQTLQAGHNLILDEVCLHISINDWRRILNSFNPICVGFKLPLETLEYRESKRYDRIQGSARDQYYRVHQNAHYDFELSDPNTNIDQLADTILKACISQ